MNFFLLPLIVLGIGFTPDGKRSHFCGEKSLFTSLSILDVECDLEGIVQRLGACGPADTHSLADLAQVAESYGTYPVIVKVRKLEHLHSGAIVHLETERGHFVTFLGFEDRDVVLGDAPMPPIRMNREYFVKRCSGNVLLVFRTEAERSAFHARLHMDYFLFAGAVFWPALIVCVSCFRRSHR